MPHQNHILSVVFAGTILLVVFLSRAEDAAPQREIMQNYSDQSATELVAALLPPQENLVNAIAQPPSQIASGLLSDLSLGKEYFSLNPDQYWPLASLTKLMTAVISLENIPEDKEIFFSSNAVAIDGNAGNFKEGEMFLRDDLVKAMMTVSSNDAAVALAESFNGGIDEFIIKMNSKALELRMNQSSFFDPSGLNLANQSNIHDIEKLILYIYRYHPEIFKWSTHKSVDLTELNSKTKRTVNSINLFAGQPGFIGGKTGYLEEANGNLASLFSYKGRIILIITLGAEDRFGETSKLYNWFKTL
ncbi:MAG: serine hydrolase [bacterium]|nr:serine hydrolase [bacterium]